MSLQDYSEGKVEEGSGYCRLLALRRLYDSAIASGRVVECLYMATSIRAWDGGCWDGNDRRRAWKVERKVAITRSAIMHQHSTFNIACHERAMCESIKGTSATRDMSTSFRSARPRRGPLLSHHFSQLVHTCHWWLHSTRPVGRLQLVSMIGDLKLSPYDLSNDQANILLAC